MWAAPATAVRAHPVNHKGAAAHEQRRGERDEFTGREQRPRAHQCKVEPAKREHEGTEETDPPNQCGGGGGGGHDRRAGGGQPAAVGVGVLLLLVLVLAVGPGGRGWRPPPPQQEAARHPQHAHGRY